jgi:hypothetical protein
MMAGDDTDSATWFEFFALGWLTLLLVACALYPVIRRWLGED